MNEVLMFLLGYALGQMTFFLVFRPFKSWQEGYDAAKEQYTDWEDGFSAGWNDAFKAIKAIADKNKIAEGEE